MTTKTVRLPKSGTTYRSLRSAQIAHEKLMSAGLTDASVVTAQYNPPLYRILYTDPAETPALKTHFGLGSDAIRGITYDYEGPGGAQRKRVITADVIYVYHQIGNDWRIAENLTPEPEPVTLTENDRKILTSAGWAEWEKATDKSGTGKPGLWSIGGWYWFTAEAALMIETP